MQPQKPVEWLKLPELAQKWRVSVRTIERLVSAKAGADRLLAAKIGGSLRVRSEVAENYAREREGRSTGTRQ